MLILDEPSAANTALLKAYNAGYRITETGKILNPSGNELKGHITNNGYLAFGISLDGKSTRIFAHRLQAYQKYGERIFSDAVVARHKNSNKLDCSSTNIIIGTETSNRLDMPAATRIAISTKSRINMSGRRFSNEDVLNIRKQLASGKSRQQVANLFGTTYLYIYKIDQRQIYKTL